MINNNSKEKEHINFSVEPNPVVQKKFKLHVKEGKDKQLKIRLQTLIKSKGLSEADFYNRLRLSRQYWYFISWGIWEAPIELKVKIARELGVDSSVIWSLKNG